MKRQRSLSPASKRSSQRCSPTPPPGVAPSQRRRSPNPPTVVAPSQHRSPTQPAAVVAAAEISYKGVSKRGNSWTARLWNPRERKNQHIGTFPTAEDAARARERAAIELGVPTSCLNFAKEEYEDVLPPQPSQTSTAGMETEEKKDGFPGLGAGTGTVEVKKTEEESDFPGTSSPELDALGRTMTGYLQDVVVPYSVLHPKRSPPPS